MQPEKEVSNLVAAKLRRAGIPFERDASIGGVRVDFLIRTTDRRKLIIEVKAWSKHQGFRNRAVHQARLYKNEIGADHALVLVDSLERTSAPEGVVNLETLIPAIRAIAHHSTFLQQRRQPPAKIRKQGGGKGASPRPKARSQPRKPTPYVFAAMPFEQQYDDVFLVAMSHAAKKVGAVCLRVDKADFTGDIVLEIQSLIRRSVAVISDLSESKPNVLYEAGYAHALNVPTVHISSTPLSELPFDVSHWNTLAYHAGQTHQLKDPLAKRLRAAIAQTANRRAG